MDGNSKEYIKHLLTTLEATNENLQSLGLKEE